MSETITEPAEPDTSAEVENTVEPEATPAVEPSPYETQEFRESVAREAEAIAEAKLNSFLESLASYAEPDVRQPQPGEPPALDPLSDTFGQDLAGFISAQQQQMLAAIDQRIQQIQAPLAARAEQETIQQGEERLKDMIADDIARNGEFSPNPEADAEARTLVRTLADNFFPSFEQRYGRGPRAAEAAINQAASVVRGLISKSGQAAVTQQTNRLGALAGLNGEPGSGTAGVVTLPDTPLDNHSLALKYGSQAKALGA